MVEGRQRDQWNHTAQVLAMLYNAWRGKGQSALNPRDFHPLMKREAPTTTLKQLKDLGLLPQSRS